MAQPLKNSFWGNTQMEWTLASLHAKKHEFAVTSWEGLKFTVLVELNSSLKTREWTQVNFSLSIIPGKRPVVCKKNRDMKLNKPRFVFGQIVKFCIEGVTAVNSCHTGHVIIGGCDSWPSVKYYPWGCLGNILDGPLGVNRHLFHSWVYIYILTHHILVYSGQWQASTQRWLNTFVHESIYMRDKCSTLHVGLQNIDPHFLPWIVLNRGRQNNIVMKGTMETIHELMINFPRIKKKNFMRKFCGLMVPQFLFLQMLTKHVSKDSQQMELWDPKRFAFLTKRRRSSNTSIARFRRGTHWKNLNLYFLAMSFPLDLWGRSILPERLHFRQACANRSPFERSWGHT